MEDVESNYNRMERDEGTAANFLHLDGCNFVGMARNSAVGLTLVMIVVPLLPLNGLILFHLPMSIIHMAICCMMGIIELPFCCTVLQICRSIQPYLAPLETYWLRGIIYILVAVGYGLANWFIVGGDSIFFWLCSAALLVVGVLYLLAFLNGERCAREWEEERGSWTASFPSTPNFLNNVFSPTSEKTDLSGDDAAKHDLEFRKAAMKAAMSTVI